MRKNKTYAEITSCILPANQAISRSDTIDHVYCIELADRLTGMATVALIHMHRLRTTINQLKHITRTIFHTFTTPCTLLLVN